MPTCGRRRYRSTNSGPAATAGRASPSRPTRPLPPPPLPLDHPPQRLTAGRAAEPLARAPLRGCEVLLTPRTIAAKKFGIVGWALALAGPVVAPARRCPAPREALPGLGRPAGARRSDSGTAGSEPGVSPDPWGSADTAGWPACRRHRRAAARHSGLQYRAWGWVGRKSFSHPLSRHRRCRGRRAP